MEFVRHVFKDLFCVWSTNINELPRCPRHSAIHCRRREEAHGQPRPPGGGGGGGQREGRIIHRQSGFHPPPCAGPSTGYLRATLQIRRYFHLAPGESRWVLEMQTLRPQPALPNENLHFNKLPRDPVLLQVGEALLWKHRKLGHVAGWWFLLFSEGKKEMEIRRKKWNA